MRKSKIIIGLGLIMVLAFTSACMPNEVEQLEGILQNVDAANGEITIVTKDGQTITLKIGTETSVETAGASSTLETLEIGASIQVEVNEDNQVVQHIRAHQTEVEGVIIQIDGDEVTIESENGQRVTILVSENTRIESEDDSLGTSAALYVGAEVETKFDPESRVAFVISGQEEEAETDDGSVKKEEAETRNGTVSEEVEGEKGTEDEKGTESEKVTGIEEEETPDGFMLWMEAERARLAEQIRLRTAAGEVDSEWVREVEAERERLAEMIRLIQEGEYKVVIIEGKAVMVAVEEPKGGTGTIGGDPPDEDLVGGDHPDDGEDDHPD